YTVSGVASGNYDVSFDSQGTCPNGVAANYATQWWNNQPSQSTATTVVVSAPNNTPNINAAMVAGGSISGKVTAAAGGGNLQGICVNVSATRGGPFVGSTGTASDG